MVRGRDACWEHCVLVDATRQKVRCNYCQREFSGGVYRMKFHLAQIKNKDIVPCTEVPTDVRDLIQNILSTPKKQKTPKKPKVDRVTNNGLQNSSSASDGFHPNPASSGQHGSTCPSLLFPRPSPSAQPEVDDAEKQKHDDADKKIALFFFHNSIPFKAMMKMIIEDKDKIEFTKEHPMYVNAQGALGSEFAVMGRTLNSPGLFHNLLVFKCSYMHKFRLTSCQKNTDLKVEGWEEAIVYAV
ncbi:zinc finger protein [Macleaya cordata]|uniref:Zinc finger protein n=1 Tax=Macleaya cordata TaxID=56857 RepID=A0A200R9Y1_MACCD|nr:zinc finger protein [Macleaya cordata]